MGLLHVKHNKTKRSKQKLHLYNTRLELVRFRMKDNLSDGTSKIIVRYNVKTKKTGNISTGTQYSL